MEKVYGVYCANQARAKDTWDAIVKSDSSKLQEYLNVRMDQQVLYFVMVCGLHHQQSPMTCVARWSGYVVSFTVCLAVFDMFVECWL